MAGLLVKERVVNTALFILQRLGYGGRKLKLDLYLRIRGRGTSVGGEHYSRRRLEQRIN